jgi:predicted membrane protein
MIKKYNDFLNEKLSDKLFGKNEEEIMDFLKSIDDPQTILNKAIKLKFIDGINYALEQSADIKSSQIIEAIEDDEIEIAKNLISHTDNILIKNIC